MRFLVPGKRKIKICSKFVPRLKLGTNVKKSTLLGMSVRAIKKPLFSGIGKLFGCGGGI
jgi:hypothetical protein